MGSLYALPYEVKKFISPQGIVKDAAGIQGPRLGARL